MMKLCSDVLQALKGETLCTAESLTGGGIGAALTAVPGASAVYLGGVVSYTDGIKEKILGVNADLLRSCGAVSSEVAAAMVSGVRMRMGADVAVSVTGLAGPGGDDFGHPVGTVFIGYEDRNRTVVQEHHFFGDRDSIRFQTVKAALRLILENR